MRRLLESLGLAPRGPEPPLEPQCPRCVVAVGDVHGRVDLLEAMLARVRHDFSELPSSSPPPLLVMLGDLIDRGPDSAACLGRVADLQRDPPFEFILLKGNHEQWLLQFLADPAQGPRWVRFGGGATLRSFGVEPPAPEAPTYAWEEARLRLSAVLPPVHAALLAASPTHHVEGDYLFVHAGVRPGRPLEAQCEADLLWIRDLFLRSKHPSPYVVIHGHTPTREPERLPWRIGVDTEAWRSGRLSAVRLNGAEQALFEVRGSRALDPRGARPSPAAQSTELDRSDPSSRDGLCPPRLR